ncbi:uncharacterized protein CC84DRAFT_1249249 [Paraphaeosphaeria sporulosa]|uniref:Uncharacterized protein n=1 Tax=Paraphaeosphaeria sporulosa TaxID=1460663 RepID=A0A177CB05_9PLEO|nr:uncharacterized protein CC84DRAFT_1249249 [Paraphaeosphaeria sporulosa]OAG03870.1 hypothetical protein CC84DRAFT_1249249 [Paraphaeosphaeria sporulosa]
MARRRMGKGIELQTIRDSWCYRAYMMRSAGTLHATIGLGREACNAWAGARTEHQTHDGSITVVVKPSSRAVAGVGRTRGQIAMSSASSQGRSGQRPGRQALPAPRSPLAHRRSTRPRPDSATTATALVCAAIASWMHARAAMTTRRAGAAPVAAPTLRFAPAANPARIVPFPHGCLLPSAPTTLSSRPDASSTRRRRPHVRAQRRRLRAGGPLQLSKQLVLRAPAAHPSQWLAHPHPRRVVCDEMRARSMGRIVWAGG